MKPIVVKIGGATLGSHDTTLEDLVTLQKKGQPVVVVHGGGKVITEWLAKTGAGTKFVRGERVTDKTALEVVTAVLAGLVNKDIVASLNRLGGNAVGISGVDGALIRSEVKERELGYVGNVAKINLALLETLLGAGYLPVVATIGFYSPASPEEKVSLLNINADAVAGEVAAALGAPRLVFLTDVPGVGDPSGRVIPELSLKEAQDLMASGVASGGMIPKLSSAVKASSSGTVSRIIDGRKPHALLRELEGSGEGTTVRG